MIESPRFDTLGLQLGEDGVAVLTIDRPTKLNALNARVLAELDEAVTWLEAERSARAVVLTGAGGKAFVAGADISEFQGLDAAAGEALSRKGQGLLRRIEESRMPWVAAIDGYALGGGAELAMACHLRVGSDRAVIGLPEVTLGLIPGYGGTQRLVHLVGRSRAMDLVLTARRVKAPEALEIGLLNRMSADVPVVELARTLLEPILAHAPLAIGHAMQAVLSAATPTGYAREAALFGDLCGTTDFEEGTRAFLEKRPPTFTGT